MADPRIGQILDGHVYKGGDPASPQSWMPVPAGWVMDGHRFKGGDPANQESWEPLSGGESTLRYVDDLGRQVASGATSGLSDEVSAFLSTVPSPRATLRETARATIEGRDPKFLEDYEARLAAERARDAEFRQKNPIAATGAELTGAIAQAALLARNPALAPFFGGGTASLGVRAARGAVGGGVLGAVSGFGHGEGGPAGRLAGAGVGGGIGAAVGGAAPVIGDAVGAGARFIAESAPGRWVGEHVVSPVARKAADVLDDVAPKAPARALSAAPPDGAPPIPADSIRTRLAERARQLASDTSADGIARKGAIDRLLLRMERDALTPDQLAAELANLGDDAALFLGGGSNVGMLAKTTARLPGRGMQIADDAYLAEARSIGPRMMGNVEQNVAQDTRFFTAFEKAAAKRSADARKLFDAARTQPLAVSEDMRVMMEIPAIKNAMASIEDDAAQLGQVLTPGEIAHRLKRKLADTADAAFASGRPVNKADIGNLAKRWRTAFHKANPTWAKTDRAYEASSRIMDALDAGRNFLIGGTGERGTQNAADALAARFKSMSGPEQEAFRVGVASTIRQQVLKGPQGARAFAKQLDESGLLREKLVEIVGPVNADRIFRMAGREIKRAAGWRNVKGGSDTAWNAAAIAEDGLPAMLAPGQQGLTARLFDYGVSRLREGARGNEAVRNELARILFSANPTERARILDELARAAATRGNRPITAGTIGAGSSGLPSIGGP